MNEEQLSSSWKQIKGQVKAKWGKLTEDELMIADGRKDYLAGRIQEHYGMAKDEAFIELNNFLKDVEQKTEVFMKDNNIKLTGGTVTVELNNLGHSIDEMTYRMAHATVEMGEKIMNIIKKHPLRTALAVGAAGLIACAIVVARKQ